MLSIEDYDCGVYACMFGDRLSKNASVTSLSPEEATQNRARLVLSLMDRRPLLEYVGLTNIEVEREQPQIEMDRGVEQQSEEGDKQEQETSINLNVKVETVCDNSDIQD